MARFLFDSLSKQPLLLAAFTHRVSADYAISFVSSFLVVTERSPELADLVSLIQYIDDRVYILLPHVLLFNGENSECVPQPEGLQRENRFYAQGCLRSRYRNRLPFPADVCGSVGIPYGGIRSVVLPGKGGEYVVLYVPDLTPSSELLSRKRCHSRDV